MGHPVTTNPFIIMLINMTVVFIVLVSLSFLIRLIHYMDPTAKKEKKVAPAVKESPAPTPIPASTKPQAPAIKEANGPIIDEGIPEETIAVIFAAIAGYGYAASEVHAIRPVYNKIWEHSGRYHTLPHNN